MEGMEGKRNRVKPEQKKMINSLPYLIKHSLFIDNDLIRKIRYMGDFAQLFFLNDDTKIKGNKAYD